MSMKIRITNESVGMSYDAKVRVFNKAAQPAALGAAVAVADNGTSYDAKVRVFNKAAQPAALGAAAAVVDNVSVVQVFEDVSAGRVLKVGQSMEAMIHSHRYVTVEEVVPD